MTLSMERFLHFSNRVPFSNEVKILSVQIYPNHLSSLFIKYIELKDSRVNSVFHINNQMS